MNQIMLPTLTRINKGIIIISAFLFIVSSILIKLSGVNLFSILGLSAEGFFKGHVWQLLTYPFISRGIMEVIFNCIMMWFIGSELERTWGQRRYIFFLLFSWVGSGLIYLLVSSLFFSSGPVYSLSLTGLAGASSALCLAYAILYPDREFTFMLIFPMKAKYFCGILIIMSLYQGIFTATGALAWGHLGAMFFGYLYMYLVSHPYFKSITPGGRLSESKGKKSSGKKSENPWSLGALKSKKAKKKSHLSLVEEEKESDDPPKYLH